MSGLEAKKLKATVSNQHKIFFPNNQRQIEGKVEIEWFLIKLFTNCSLKMKIAWNIFICIFILIPTIISLSNHKFSCETSLDRIMTLNALSEYLFLFYITLFHQWTFRESVVDQINQLWININLPANQLTQRQLFKERSVCVILAMSYVLIVFSYRLTSGEFQFLDWNSILRSLFFIVVCLSYAVLYCCVHFQLVMEMVILLTASFDYVNNLIELQVKNGPTLHEIKSIRRLYTDIVQLTDYVAESFKILITLIYLKTTYLIVTISYTMFISGYTISSTFWMTLAYSIGPIIMLFITFRIIKLNISAYSSFDDIYTLTQYATSKEMKFELLMFIHRVSRNDIGLKFCRTTLIGPNFFSTLLTICITSFCYGIAFVLHTN